jgi:AI-2 transport protein TqsA
MRVEIGTGAKAVVGLAALVIALSGLQAASDLLLPLCVAVLLVGVSLPAVSWMEARGVPHLWAIAVAVLAQLGLVIGVAALIGGTVGAFTARVPLYQARLADMAAGAARLLEDAGWESGPEALAEAVRHLGLMRLVSNLLESVADLFSKTLLVALLVLFMLFEAGRWRVKMAYVFSEPSEDLPRFAAAAREIQRYLVLKTALNVIIGVLFGAVAWLFGLDFFLLWGLLAFLLNYIPTLGPFLATVPPVAIALVQLGPVSALAVLLVYLGFNFVLGSLVEPRVMGRALGLSPLVVLSAMVFWAWLWGPVGALLAVPLTMLVKIVASNTEDLRWVAVLLGSQEWLEEMRREWGDRPVEEAIRQSLPPAAPLFGEDPSPPTSLDEDEGGKQAPAA